MSFKKIILLLDVVFIVYLASVYFSDKKTSERNFNNMLITGNIDISIIENYIKHNPQYEGEYFNKAMLLAAELDDKYLDKLITLYSRGEILLTTSTAKLILNKLPSDSININYVAGRIYSSNEFNEYNPQKAVKLLNYAALRDNKNAAEILSQIYTQSNCYIEAITWAKQANKRGISSECTELPVNVNLLTDDEWDAVVYNEDEIESAIKSKRLPKLRYSDKCIITK